MHIIIIKYSDVYTAEYEHLRVFTLSPNGLKWFMNNRIILYRAEGVRKREIVGNAESNVEW